METDHHLAKAALATIEAAIASMHITITRLAPANAASILREIQTIQTRIERAAHRPHGLLKAKEFTEVHRSLRRLLAVVLPQTSDTNLSDGLLNIDYVLESTYAEEYEAARRRMGLTSIWRAGHIELDDVAFHGVRRMVYRPQLSTHTIVTPSTFAALTGETEKAAAHPTPLELEVRLDGASVTYRQLWRYADQLLERSPGTPKAAIESIKPDPKDATTLVLLVEP